jgi:hypothetical protein
MQCSARIGGHWPGNTLHTMSSMRWRLASAATECDALTANTQCVLNAWLRLLRRKLPRPQTRIGMLLGVSRRSCFRLLTQRVIIFDALGHHRRVCEVVSAIRASWWEPSLGFPAGCYGLIELLIGSKSCSIANLSCSLWRACSAFLSYPGADPPSPQRSAHAPKPVRLCLSYCSLGEDFLGPPKRNLGHQPLGTATSTGRFMLSVVGVVGRAAHREAMCRKGSRRAVIRAVCRLRDSSGLKSEGVRWVHGTSDCGPYRQRSSCLYPRCRGRTCFPSPKVRDPGGRAGVLARSAPWC